MNSPIRNFYILFTYSVLFVFCGIHFSFSDGEKFPYQDQSLSFEKRVADLVGRMTLEEKVSQMQNGAVAIQRLGIPAYNWWNECLHGVGRSGDKVTVFPQAIGLAATFDSEAMEKTGSIISDEARAVYHQALKTGGGGAQYKGLTFWSPNINIFRDPRWGRGQETYGEDPYLTGVIGMAFVHGLQGNDPKYLKSSACAKHYAVHSGPEFGRHEFNSSVDNYDLWDTYLPAFRNLIVDAGVSGVMCAYNRFNGQPCCGNDKLMTDILRNQWHFNGYVTSDCGAIDDFFQTNWAAHRTHPNAASAASDAVIHGTDIDCGSFSYKGLFDAIKQGLITEAQIDESVKRLFMIRFRLGMFDDQNKVPYSSTPYSILENATHKEHALKMARESMVLLKNENQTLPLSKKIHKIVVVGPNADNEEILLGNYNGIPSEIITPLEGIKAKTKAEIIYIKGSDYTQAIPGEQQPVLDAIKGADVVVFAGGISPRLEGEEGDAGKEKLDGFLGGDRTTIILPEAQTSLMKSIKASGVPLVFISMSGSAIAFTWEAENADAIIQAWYGGQSAGTAIADILFGDYNPSGRLPITFYKEDKDLPPFNDYSMKTRTYKYFKGAPLYPFGYGLSFTDFSYEWIQKPLATYTGNDKITCSVKIRNTGNINGDEVVQAYIQYPENRRLPVKELRQIKRITLQKGKDGEVDISIPVSQLKKWDSQLNGEKVQPGTYRIFLGGNSEDRKLVSSFEIK